jgi:hypothetical protein
MTVSYRPGLLPLPLAGEGWGEGAALPMARRFHARRPALTPTLSRKREREQDSAGAAA